MPGAKKTRRLTDAQRKLVEDNLGIVARLSKFQARRLDRRTEWKDAVQGGVLGACRSALSYDPSLAFKFATYLGPAVSQQAGLAALEARMGLFHGWSEWAKLTPASREAASRGSRVARLTGRALAGLQSRWADEREEAEDAEDARVRVGRLLRVLDARSRDIVERVYFRGELQSDVARSMGLCRERVRQLHRKALEKMRKHAERAEGGSRRAALH